MIDSVIEWLKSIFKPTEEQYLEEAKDVSELEYRMISLGKYGSSPYLGLVN